MSEKINYYRFPGTTVIVACMEIENGYHVVCHSACADPERFDETAGKAMARARCIAAAAKIRHRRENGLDNGNRGQ